MNTKYLSIATAISLSLFFAKSAVYAEGNMYIALQDLKATQTASQTSETMAAESFDQPKVQLYQFPSVTEPFVISAPGSSIQIGGAISENVTNFNKIDGKDNTQFFTKENLKSPIKKSKLSIKAEDKISARTSNVGDTFYLTTLSPIDLNGTTFPTGSIVKGKVMTVVRPCVFNSGSIRIDFSDISYKDTKANLPEYIYSIKVEKSKNPNIIARTIAMPFTLSGRLIGITGRTVGVAPVVAGNSVEAIGDGFGTSALEFLSLKPMPAARSFGSSFVALSEGVFGILRAAVTGTYGLIADTADEAVYVVYPMGTNTSSINPDEELGITFGIISN